jgi:hypothetical protein
MRMGWATALEASRFVVVSVGRSKAEVPSMLDCESA